MALTQSDNAINAYEGFKQSYGNTAMYNALGGDKGLSDAIASGNSGYANSFLSAVMDADKLGSVNSFKSSYRTDFLDNNDKLTAAVNELYGDRITQNEYTRYKTDDNGNYELDDDGNPIEETYYDTEYNYTKSALNERAEQGYQNFLIECEQAIKDGWSGWRKFWSATGSFLMNLGADVLDTIKDDLMFIGVGIESIWNRGALQRYYRNEGEFEGWGAGILSDLMADFDTQYTVLRKADGTTTGIGNVLYGVANTFGVMIPSMLTNLIPVAGAAGSVGAIIGNVAKQSVYWFSLGVGNIKDYMIASPDASFTQICLTSFGVAACQAAVTYVNSFIFGGTFLEKLTLGINTEGGGIFGVLSSSLRGLGGGAGTFFKSGIGRFVTDFLIEGTKQWYEEEWQENCQAWVEAFSAHCNNNFNQIFELSGEQYLNAMAMSFLTSFISTGFHYAGVAVKRVDNEAMLTIKNTDILDENGNLKEGHTADELKFKAKKRTVAETLGITEVSQQMTSLTQQLQKILDKYTSTEETTDENGKTTKKQSLSEDISEKDQAKIKILTSALVNASQIMGQYYNASGEENFKMAIDTLNKVSESQEKLNVIVENGGYVSYIQSMITDLHANAQLQGLEKLSSELVASRITDLKKVLALNSTLFATFNHMVDVAGEAVENAESPTALSLEERHSNFVKARTEAQAKLNDINEEIQELTEKANAKAQELQHLNQLIFEKDENLRNYNEENNIAETERDVRAYENERNRLRNKLNEEIKKNGETKYADELRDSINKMEAHLEELKNSMSYILEMRDALQADIDADTKSRDALESEINEFDNQLNDKNFTKNDLEMEIARNDIEIKNLEFDRYEEVYEEKLAKAREIESKNYQERLKEAQAEQKEAEDNWKNANQRIEEIDKEIEELEGNVKDLSLIESEGVLGDEIRRLTEELRDIQDEIKETKALPYSKARDKVLENLEARITSNRERVESLIGKNNIEKMRTARETIAELKKEQSDIKKSLPELKSKRDSLLATSYITITRDTVANQTKLALQEIDDEHLENQNKIKELKQEEKDFIKKNEKQIAIDEKIIAKRSKTSTEDSIISFTRNEIEELKSSIESEKNRIEGEIDELRQRNRLLKDARKYFTDYISDKQSARENYLSDNNIDITSDVTYEAQHAQNAYANPDVVNTIAELNLTERQSKELERLESLTGDDTVIVITGDGRGIVAETLVVNGEPHLYYFVPQSIIEANKTAGEMMKMAEENSAMYEIANGTVFGMYADKLVQLFKHVYGEERIMPVDSEALGDMMGMDMKISVLANLLYNQDFLEIAMAAYAEEVIQFCGQLPAIFEAIAQEKTTSSNAQKKISENVAKSITDHVRKSLKQIAIYEIGKTWKRYSINQVFAGKAPYNNHSIYMEIMALPILTQADVKEIQNALYQNEKDPAFFSNEKLQETTKEQMEEIRTATANNGAIRSEGASIPETVFNIWLRNNGLTLDNLKVFYRTKNASSLPSNYMQKLIGAEINTANFAEVKQFIEEDFSDVYNYEFKVNDNFNYPITHYLHEKEKANFTNPINTHHVYSLNAHSINSRFITTLPPENSAQIIKSLLNENVPTDMASFVTIADLIAMPQLVDFDKIKKELNNLTINRMELLNAGKEALDVLSYYLLEKYSVDTFVADGNILLLDTRALTDAVNKNVLNQFTKKANQKIKKRIGEEYGDYDEKGKQYAITRERIEYSDLKAIKKADGTSLIGKVKTMFRGKIVEAEGCYISDIIDKSILIENGFYQDVAIAFQTTKETSTFNAVAAGSFSDCALPSIHINTTKGVALYTILHEITHYLQYASQYIQDTSTQIFNATFHAMNNENEVFDSDNYKTFVNNVMNDLRAHLDYNGTRFIFGTDESEIDNETALLKLMYYSSPEERNAYPNFDFPSISCRQHIVDGNTVVTLTFDWGNSYDYVVPEATVEKIHKFAETDKVASQTNGASKAINSMVHSEVSSVNYNIDYDNTYTTERFNKNKNKEDALKEIEENTSEIARVSISDATMNVTKSMSDAISVATEEIKSIYDTLQKAIDGIKRKGQPRVTDDYTIAENLTKAFSTMDPDTAIQLLMNNRGLMDAMHKQLYAACCGEHTTLSYEDFLDTSIPYYVITNNEGTLDNRLNGVAISMNGVFDLTRVINTQYNSNLNRRKNVKMQIGTVRAGDILFFNGNGIALVDTSTLSFESNINIHNGREENIHERENSQITIDEITENDTRENTSGIFITNADGSTVMVSLEEFQATGMYVDAMRNIASNQMIIDQENDLLYVLNPVKDGYEIIVDPLTNNNKLITRDRFNEMTAVGGEFKIGKVTEISQMINTVTDILENPDVSFEIKEKLRRAVSKYIDLSIADAQITTPGNFVFETKDGKQLLLPELSRDGKGNVVITDNSRADGETFSADDIKYFKMLHPEKLEQEGDKENGIDTDSEEESIATDDASSIIWAPTKFDKPIEEYLQLTPAQFAKEVSSMSSEDFNALRTAFDIYVFKTFKTGDGLNDLPFRQLRVRAMTLATQAYRNNGYNNITITSDEILRFFESQSKDAWAEVDNTILSDYFKARMISDPTKFAEYITNLEFSDLQRLSEKLSSIDIYNRFLDEMTESKNASQNVDLYTNSVQLLHAFIDGDLAFINAQMVSKGMENGLILRSQATEGLELDTEIFATDIANTLVLPHREKVDFVNTLNDEELARMRKSVELYYERVKRSRISPTLTADMLSILNAEMLKRSATKGTIDENWLAKKAVEAGVDKNKLKKSINYNNKNRALWLNLFAGRSFGNGVAATGKSEIVTWDEVLRAGIQSDNAKQNALDILVKNILGIADPFISTEGSELNFENLSSPKQRAKGVYADEIANSTDNPVGYAKVFDALINLDISTTDVVISKLFGLIFKNIYPGINLDTYKMDYNGYKSVYETLQIRARDAQKANMRGTQAMKEATKNDKAKAKCYSELFLPLMRALGAYQAYSTLITYTREIPMNDMLAQVYSVAFLPTYFKYDFICKYINPSEYGMWYASIKDAIDKMPYTQGARSLRSELSEFLRVFDDVLDSMSASSTMKGYFNSVKQLDYSDINTMYKELTEAVRGTNLHEKINAANVDSLDNRPVEKDVSTTQKTLESGKTIILPKSVKEYGTGKEYFLTSERIGPRAYKGSTFEKLGFTDPDGVQELWLPLQMQGFIIESNFDPSRSSTEVISPSLQDFIWAKNTGLKKGKPRGKNVTPHREQFDSADMRQYLRTVNENDINDYTFKQINKWFFQNNNIGTMKELTTIAEMSENIWEINHVAEMARRDRNALATLDGIFDPYKKYNSKEVWEILGSIIDKNEYLKTLYEKSSQIYTYYKPAQTTEKTVWVTENGKRIKKTEIVQIEGTAIERSIDAGNRRTVTMDHYTGNYKSMLHIANIVLLLSNSIDNPLMPKLKNATRSGNNNESLDKVNDNGETPANQVEDPNAKKTYAKIDKKFTNEDIENLDDMDTWENLADTVQDILDTTSEKGQRDAVFTAFIKEIFITQYRKEVLAKNPQIGEVSDDAIWRNGKGFTTLLKPNSQAKIKALAKQRLSNLTQNQIAKDFVLLWLSQNSDIKFDLKTATAENEVLDNVLETLFTTNEGKRIQRQSLRSAIIKNIDFVTQYFSFIQMDQLMKDHPDLFVHDEKTGESHFITREDTKYRSEIILKKIRQELDAVVSDFHSGKYGTKEWKAALQKAKELQKENDELKKKLAKEKKAGKEAVAKQIESDNQKYQDLLKKHNDLKKQLSQEHGNVRSIQRQIDKTTSVSIILTSDGTVDIPESLVKILTVAVDDLNLTKRQVQLVPESGTKNIALDLEKFFDANAETFSQCTQKDFEAIINFLDTATLGNNFYTAEDITTDEKNISTKVFETYSLWTLAYIMEMRDSGLLDLSEEMNDKLNNAYENKASFAGAYLNAVKQAVDHLHPYAKYVQTLAEMYDINVDEQELTGFALAVSQHIGEKVNRNQLIAMMVPREEVDRLFEKYGVGEWLEITETTKPIIVGDALKHLSDDWLTSIKLKNAGHAFDKLFAWEQMCLLSWPGTWIRNISSNIVLRSLNSVGDRIGSLFGKGKRTQEKLSNIEEYMRQKNEGLETPQDYYMYQITGIHPSTEVVDAVNRLFDSVITIDPATGKPVTFWSILSDSSNRYSNMMRTTTGRSKANVDRLTELITSSLASKLRAQNRFSSPKQKTVLDKTTGDRVVKTKDGETIYKSKFQEKSEDALNKTSNLLFKALSDDPWIKKTTRKYFTRMLTERMNDATDPITVNNITVENNKVLDIFAEAYSEAAWQYMHKKSPMASLDESIKKKLGSGGWFVWKQLMPFANATWNWGMEALNFSPIGIIRGVTQLCRLDRNFIKNDKLLDMGEQLPSGNFALYNARKMIGKGVIGTALFGLGIAFAALGIIALDKKDDKIKLYFGNDTYLDVSQLFGTSSFLAGAGFMYTLTESDDETNNKIWAAFSTVLDSLFDDSIFNDFLNSFEYSTSIGDWIEYNFINSFSAFIPNLYKKAIEGSYDFSIQYDNGILGQLEKLGTKIIPVLAYTFPKKYDIYTGEAVSTYRIPFLWKWVNSLSPIDYEPYNISTQEQIARALGVNKGLLTGDYDDIGKLTTKQKVALNEMYGKLNKQALEDLMNNKISVNVQNEDGTYSVLKWNKMTDKQKASAINSLMTKNASYAKTYVYTSLMGGKYYASENELTTLRGLGIRQNVYLSTSTKSGYA